MIRHFKVENFMSLENVSFDCENVNIIIGPNASGKSNIIQALRFLHSIATESSLIEAIQKLQAKGPLLFINALFSEISFEIVSEMIAPVIMGIEDTDILGYHLTFGYDDRNHETILLGKPVIKTELFGHHSDDGEFDLPPIINREGNDIKFGVASFPLRPLNIKSHSTALKAFGAFDVQYLSAYLDSIAAWSFLEIDRNRLLKKSVSANDLKLEPDGSNLFGIVYMLMSIEDPRYDMILEDLRMLLKQIKKLDSLQIYEDVQLFVEESFFQSRRLPIESLSSGSLNLLAMLTALHILPETGVLCIEEPEHGLHPALLSTLADIFREHCDTYNKQVFFTTHAPDLVDAALPEEVIVTDRDESGATIVRKLDKEGISKFLDEFRLGELWRRNGIEGFLK